MGWIAAPQGDALRRPYPPLPHAVVVPLIPNPPFSLYTKLSFK